MRQSLVRAKQTGGGRQRADGRAATDRRTDGRADRCERFMGYRWELWVTDGRSGGGGRGSKRAAERMYVVVVDGQGGYGNGQENQRVDPPMGSRQANQQWYQTMRKTRDTPVSKPITTSVREHRPSESDKRPRQQQATPSRPSISSPHPYTHQG